MAIKSKKVYGEKKLRTHPTYAEMIKEAITALKERSGSSQIAIAKFIEDKHKAQNLAPNYKKLLLSQLKKLVASGSLVKVKHSFKLGAPTKPKKAETKPKKGEAKSKKGATPVKAKKVVVKVKKMSLKKSDVMKLEKKVATPAVMKAKKAVKVKAEVKKPKSIKLPMKKVTKKAKK